MSHVLSCEAFSLEHVSEMPLAVSAYDLNAIAVSVRVPLDLAWDFVIKGRPAATAVELAL